MSEGLYAGIVNEFCNSSSQSRYKTCDAISVSTENYVSTKVMYR